MKVIIFIVLMFTVVISNAQNVNVKNVKDDIEIHFCFNGKEIPAMQIIYHTYNDFLKDFPSSNIPLDINQLKEKENWKPYFHKTNDGLYFGIYFDNKSNVKVTGVQGATSNVLNTNCGGQFANVVLNLK